MRKPPSPKTPTPKAAAPAPVLTLFDAPPTRVSKPTVSKPTAAKTTLPPKPTASPKTVPVAEKSAAPAKAAPKAAVLHAATKPILPVKTAQPKVSTVKASPAKATLPKVTKKITVQAASSKAAPVRVVAETAATYFTGGSGRAWRMSGKHAVAYVQNAVLAGELLATEPRHLAKAAMAVYFDRKGKPFAWQFRFDTTRWEEVIGRLA